MHRFRYRRCPGSLPDVMVNQFLSPEALVLREVLDPLLVHGRRALRLDTARFALSKYSGWTP